jgi:hypothetical protein
LFFTQHSSVYTTLSKNFYHSGFFPLPIRKKPLDLQNLDHATLGEVPRVFFFKFEAH